MHPRLSVLFSCIAWVLINGCTARHGAQTQETAKKPEQKPESISIPPTGVIRISANDLLAEFRADENAADRVFRDRTVEVTGKVVCVWKTVLD
jgi:tRNA_anti-like